MPEFSFTVTEYSPDKPWLVVGSEHRTVQLDDREDFHDWAHERWPEPRWRVDANPWQLSPGT
jgi:hypothetical protein